MPTRKRSDVDSQPRMAGPLWIHTLRGELLGRQVALVCCGEAHEDCIDLTRSNSVPFPELVLVEDTSAGGTLLIPKERQLGRKKGVTLKQAQVWATKIFSGWDDFDEEQGALVFTADRTNRSGQPVGTAFIGTVDRDECPGALKGEIPPQTSVFLLLDADVEAARYQQTRIDGAFVPDEELDALIAARKQRLLRDSNTELFDDWLLRLADGDDPDPASSTPYPTLRVVLEAPVAADDVELHTEAGVDEPPVADPCIRAVDLDSDTDSDDDYDPDDGTGTYLAYLQRRIESSEALRHNVQAIDPRILGDAEDDISTAAFQALQIGPTPADAEMIVLAESSEGSASIAPAAAAHVTPEPDGPPQSAATDPASKGSTPTAHTSHHHHRKETKDHPVPIPSWEAYFGASGDLLYYSPHVKADYAQFLAHCVCTPTALSRFFHELYFGTVQAALAHLKLTEATRPLASIRSAIYQPSAAHPMLSRGNAGGEVPVKSVPISRFLKAKGSNPPRLWVSGLVDESERAGLRGLVQRARTWFDAAVQKLLDDPKRGDPEGDYFKAWLHECHRDVYDDLDVDDPADFCRRRWAPSESGKPRYDLNKFTIPSIDEAFQEFALLAKESRRSTTRERVLAEILIDIYQIRMVDLASILSVAKAVISASKHGEPCVVVYYGGADHTAGLVNFWLSEGWESQGVVGKDEWDDHESRGLKMPPYLRGLRAMFPTRKRSGAGGTCLSATADATTLEGTSANNDTNSIHTKAPVAAVAADAMTTCTGPLCSVCGVHKPRKHFNSGQLKKPPPKRRCRDCTAAPQT